MEKTTYTKCGFCGFEWNTDFLSQPYDEFLWTEIEYVTCQGERFDLSHSPDQERGR